jgi:DtxR family Mn-dependent transcriptional regulator
MSDHLADRLDLFLDYPSANPLGEPIPRCGDLQPDPQTVTLSALSAGQRGRVIRYDAGGSLRSFLEEQGVRPGAWLDVLAETEDRILVQVGKEYLSLAQSLAGVIQVIASTPGEHTK